ncbi:MAG: NADH-quinone oxidoreductase subunit N [Candidatus Marinimicrobia bacterium]|nr:NADH-quinone oxidoreductase subunit N [Candidatus Neomarinimicrobiota bacterium]
MNNFQSLRLFIPELIILSTILVAIIADLFYSKEKSYKVGYWVLTGLLLAMVVLWLTDKTEVTTLFLNSIALDPFSRIFKFIFILATLFVIIMSMRASELQKVRTGEYFVLLAVVVLGMFLMASSIDLIMVYISIEVVSIASFILAGYLKTEVRSNEASLKYVIYGAFSSGIMLYGLSLLFGLTGTTKLFEISEAIARLNGEGNLTLIIATIFIMAGFGYKISAVPFHFWTPDVYEGAPTPITAYLSVAPKAAGFALLIRFFNSLFGTGAVFEPGTWQSLEGIPWQQVIAVVAAITMALGNLVAIQQSNIKRLLAYSSIAHAGYILMGIPVLSQDGIHAMIFYIIVYLFMQLGAFFVAILISNKFGTEEIAKYSGIGFKSPLLGVLMALFMFSLTGIPPTAGFIGKFYLFAALINGGSQFYWLAIWGVLNSVVSLYYYMRIVKVMFFEGQSELELYLPSAVPTTLLMVFGIPTLLFGVYWSPIADWVQNSLIFFVVRM